MTDSLGQMSRSDLTALVESIVERKLLDILGDPDEGLELRTEVRRRLLMQLEQVAAGERGRPLEDVLSEMPGK